ncbi:ATP-grasp domain-containing protein [Rubinisphaera italica]|nr:ATP-grasp domain-containing protein [Rubinisphaera italica]
MIIYVESLYAPTIAEMVGRRLLDLPEDWLVKLPYEFRHRDIQLMTLGEARKLSRPRFIKPPNDKSFTAQVYETGANLPLDYENDQAVLVIEPVQWRSEFRCFCLDGNVLTLSPYLRNGVLAKGTNYEATEFEFNQAIEFAEKALSATMSFTPRAVVIDVGQIEGQGWSVVEANAAWGSGIYGCNPDLVLDVIRCSTIRV